MPSVTIRPSANGVVGLTPSAGANWQCTSDDSDATWVYGANGIDNYALGNTGATGFVTGIDAYFRLQGIGYSGAPYATLSISCGSLIATSFNSGINTYGGSCTLSDRLTLAGVDAATCTLYMDGNGGIAYCMDLWFVVTYIVAPVNIWKYGGQPVTGLSKIDGIAIASISKVNGV